MTKQPADRCKLPPAFWKVAESVGLSASALLRQARLPATLHVAPEPWLTTAQYFALWRAVEALSGNPTIGLKMTVESQTSVYPPATLSAFFAKDYRDGLLRLARFKRLCTPEQLMVTEKNGKCRVSAIWLHTHEAEPAAAADVTFAAIVELGRRGSGHHIVPIAVEMARPGPAAQTYEAYFGVPVQTNCRENALILRQSDLDLPFAGHNPELLSILEPSLTEALGEIEAQSSLIDQVKIMIKRRVASGKPELADVARELGLSQRTLQRRITEHGENYRNLVDLARQELGRQLLSDSQNGVDEVAFLLGFQETSSFYRAFRSWEGVTPAQWRQQH